jgi:hypothetical protein
MSSPQSPTNKLRSSNKNSLTRAVSGQAHINSKPLLVHGNHKRMVIAFRETSTVTLTIKTHVTHIIRNTTQMVGRMVGVTASQIRKTILEKEASTVITSPIPTRAAGPMMRCGSTTELECTVVLTGTPLSISSIHHIQFGTQSDMAVAVCTLFLPVLYICFPSHLSSYCLILFYFAC